MAEATGAWTRDASTVLLAVSKAVAVRTNQETSLLHAQLLQLRLLSATSCSLRLGGSNVGERGRGRASPCLRPASPDPTARRTDNRPPEEEVPAEASLGDVVAVFQTVWAFGADAADAHESPP